MGVHVGGGEPPGCLEVESHGCGPLGVKTCQEVDKGQSWNSYMHWNNSYTLHTALRTAHHCASSADETGSAGGLGGWSACLWDVEGIIHTQT